MGSQRVAQLRQLINDGSLADKYAVREQCSLRTMIANSFERFAGDRGREPRIMVKTSVALAYAAQRGLATIRKSRSVSILIQTLIWAASTTSKRRGPVVSRLDNTGDDAEGGLNPPVDALRQ